MKSEIRPFRNIKRKKTKEISVGKLKVGGDNPITVQWLIHWQLTINLQQNKFIKLLKLADIVRVSCPDSKSTEALKTIIKHVDVPLVADIHFHYKRAIEAAENGADCSE